MYVPSQSLDHLFLVGQALFLLLVRQKDFEVWVFLGAFYLRSQITAVEIFQCDKAAA